MLFIRSRTERSESSFPTRKVAKKREGKAHPAIISGGRRCFTRTWGTSEKLLNLKEKTKDEKKTNVRTLRKEGVVCGVSKRRISW